MGCELCCFRRKKAEEPPASFEELHKSLTKLMGRPSFDDSETLVENVVDTEKESDSDGEAYEPIIATSPQSGKLPSDLTEDYRTASTVAAESENPETQRGSIGETTIDQEVLYESSDTPPQQFSLEPQQVEDTSSVKEGEASHPIQHDSSSQPLAAAVVGAFVDNNNRKDRSAEVDEWRRKRELSPHPVRPPDDDDGITIM